MNYTIHHGDNRDTLKTLADNSVDAIITDPPYGIDFLGKEWDANTGALETYQECLRVLKPGGYILAFSAAKTYHHLAITLEQAGFEIRDQIMWLYASGFPKAQDIGKAIDKRAGNKDENYGSSAGKSGAVFDQFNHALCNKCGKGVSYEAKCQDQDCGMRYKYQSAEAQQWAGWKTALKPAHEPICMARKPFKGSTIDNVLAHGVGALNIDATRVPFEDTNIAGMKRATGSNADTFKNFSPEQRNNKDKTKDMDHGLEEVVYEPNEQGRFPSNVLGEVEGYQKYFYCPKVSRAERHTGFEGPGPSHNEMAQAMGGSLIDHDGNPSVSGNKAMIPGLGEIYTHGLSKHYDDWCKQNGHGFKKGNNHPTVKPVALMRYLIQLVTPPNSTVLDPFTGSGSTGMAAVELGHTFIGCELDPDYVKIAETRISAWNTPEPSNTTFEALFDAANPVLSWQDDD